VLVWPDKHQVHRAVESWARGQVSDRPELLRLGYFGSYARGDWGVGSDLDIIAVVRDSSEPFDRRPLSWDLLTLPVPAEILVYTETEFAASVARDDAFARTLANEVVWLIEPARASPRDAD
jgi:predicted nucleotidyltransferase